jgi:GAF domain-containing protein
MEVVLQAVVDFIPPAIQFPEITCARVIFGDYEIKTKNFKDTIWKLSREITVSNKWVGTLEVCYLEEKPELDEGPFHKEAKDLINAVAENIAKIIEREEAEAAIRKHQNHIEALIKKTATKTFLEKTNE